MTRYCTSREASPRTDRHVSSASPGQSLLARLRGGRLVRRLKECRGANIVEMALVMPLLFLLTFSIVDFASMFYVYLALENGVSQATRYAVTGNLVDDPLNPGSKLSRDDSIKTIMRQATPTLYIGDTDFVFTHKAPGAAAWSAGSGGPGEIGRVEINHAWKFLNPLLWPFFPPYGQITLTAASAMKNESLFK